MKYQNVFAKTYFQKQDDSTCEEQGRNPANCPATKVIDNILKKVYGPALECSKCECSMSLVSRPDPFFGVFKHRSTRQVFLFDKYFPFDYSKSLIGALDVRCPSAKELNAIPKSTPWGSAVWCAMGYLAPPGYMMVDGGYVLPLLDFYSVHGGLHPFLCTPYISHHRFFGYVCVQAAVYLALEMTLRLQSSPHSPATISHIISEEMQYPTPIQIHEHVLKYCTKHAPKRTKRLHHSDGFYFRGLSSRELEHLLDNHHLNTNSLTLHLNSKDTDNLEERVTLHVKSMLHSHIPLIAFVDYNTLAESLGGDFSGSDDAHVITIIGYRISSKARKFRIVFHDGHLGPYRELDIDVLVKAALECSKQRVVRLFSPIPRNVDSKGYLNLFNSARSVLGREDFDCVIQLCSLGQLLKYLSKYSPGREIKFQVGNSRDLQETELEYLTGLREEDPIWIVGYNQLVPVMEDNKGNTIDTKEVQQQREDDSIPEKHFQTKQRVLLDLFHVGGEQLQQRIGVIDLGVCPEKGSWKFLAVSGEKKDRRKNPIWEKDFEKGCETYSITHH